MIVVLCNGIDPVADPTNKDTTSSIYDKSLLKDELVMTQQTFFKVLYLLFNIRFQHVSVELTFFRDKKS